MGYLLFSPNGRIAKHRFWQGMVVLTVASVLISAGAWLLNPILGVLSYALIFPYICVYGKRLHDGGSSAWWVIGVWGAAIILQLVLFMIFFFAILPNLMTPDQKEILEDIIKLAEAGDNAETMKGVEFLMEQMDGVFQRAILVLIVMTNTIVALVLGSFRSDPRENQYGPVPSELSGGTFD